MVEVIVSRNLARGTVESEPLMRSLGTIMSIEDVFSEDADWTENLANNYDAYRKVSLVRSCINILAHFSTQKGFRTIVQKIDGDVLGDDDVVKKYVDRVNQRVNMDHSLYIGIIKREIDGRAGFEVVDDGEGNITSLLPLVGSRLRPVISKETFQIEGFEYVGTKDGKYNVNKVLYFTLNALKTDQLGLSAIDAIKTVLKLKRNLEKDLLETAKRLWAPVGLFEIDTSAIIDATKKQEVITKFESEIKPGQSIVHNQKVQSKILDLRPDINGLVRAIEKADEEIMGNWMIPKALVSREKSVTKATLEYSLKALWEGPIASVQRYFKRELERQWYPKVLASAGKGWEDKYEVKHVFIPLAVADPALIMSIVKAVEANILTEDDFYNIIGWDIEGVDRVEPDVETPPPPPPRREEPTSDEMGGA